MIPCSACTRFVHDGTPACPFCGAPIRDARSPNGGFLGVLLGLCLAGCGGDDAGTPVGEGSATTDTSSSSGMTVGGSAGDSTATAGPVTTGPLYGPVTTADDTATSGDATSGDATSSGGDSGTSTAGDTTGATDTGDSTSGGPDTVGPLYGPATG